MVHHHQLYFFLLFSHPFESGLGPMATQMSSKDGKSTNKKKSFIKNKYWEE